MLVVGTVYCLNGLHSTCVRSQNSNVLPLAMLASCSKRHRGPREQRGLCAWSLSISTSDLSALPAPILNSSRNIGIIPVARTYAVEGLKDWYNLGKLKMIEKRVKSSTWLGSVLYQALLSLCLPVHTAAFVGLGLRSPTLWQKWGHFPPIL